MLPFPNHDTAVSAAAHLAFGRAWRNAFSSNATGHSISAALVPLFGISWTKKVIIDVKTNRINELLAKIRNVDIPRADYDRLADLFKLAFFCPTCFPPEWEEWPTTAERYRLDRRHSWQNLASVASQFISDDVNSPFELAVLEAAEIESMGTSFDCRLTARARLLARRSAECLQCFIGRPPIPDHARCGCRGTPTRPQAAQGGTIARPSRYSCGFLAPTFGYQLNMSDWGRWRALKYCAKPDRPRHASIDMRRTARKPIS